MQTNYIQSYSGDIYKVLPDHFLKISPWKDGEDRRVYEFDSSSYTAITYKNACVIVNKQFNDSKETWTHKSKKYVADPLTVRDVNMHTSMLRLLPSHNIISSSTKLVSKLETSNAELSIPSDDGLSELKLIKHNGKIYYIMIVNEFLPRVKAYNLLGEFCQWVGIKNCKPIYCETDQRFV